MLLRGLRTFVFSDRHLKRVAVEALFEVPYAMVAIRRSSFGDSCRRLGERSLSLDVPERSLTDEERREARRIGIVTKRIATTIGGLDTCFPQAISATRMLARRGVATYGIIGVRRGEIEPFDSHAWVIAGALIVTGAGPHRSHVPVLAFEQHIAA